MGLGKFYRDFKIQKGLLNASERIVEGYSPKKGEKTKEGMKKNGNDDRLKLLEEKDEKIREGLEESFSKKKKSELSKEQKTVNKYEEQFIEYLLKGDQDFQKLVVDKLVENINEIKKTYGKGVYEEIIEIFGGFLVTRDAVEEGEEKLIERIKYNDFKDFYDQLVDIINDNRNVLGFALAEAFEGAKRDAKSDFKVNRNEDKKTVSIILPEDSNSGKTVTKDFEFYSKWEAQKTKYYIDQEFIKPRGDPDKNKIKDYILQLS